MRKGIVLKSMAAAMLATLLFGMTSLAATATASTGVTQVKETQAQDAQAAKKKFGFTYNEVRYEVGMDAAAAMKTLGESNGSREVNTCANGYINRAYTYGKGESKDFEVYVEQDRVTGKDIVASITLLTSSVATEEGLKVGDGADAVTKAYPNAAKGLGTYKVNEGSELLYIKITGGKVAYISYMTAAN